MLNKIMILMMSLFAVVLSGCEDECGVCPQPDGTPSTVFITYPINNSTVSEIATITCMVADLENFDRVTLWVDGYQIPGAEDSSEPYELYWNTAGYEDRSLHTIIVRAYYNSNRFSDSKPIILRVDNTPYNPSQVNIQSILYQDNSFIITWHPSRDGDFYGYILCQSLDRSMVDKTEIYTSTNVNDTVYVVENVGVDERRYYQLSVIDTIGLETQSLVHIGSSYDLVAYYPFSGNANDEGGNELHGRVRGAYLTEDRDGNPNSAYYFNGDYSKIDMNGYSELCIDGDLTISIWMQAHSFEGGIPAIVNCQALSEEPETNGLYSLSFFDYRNSLVYHHEYGFGNDHFHEFTDFNFEVDEWYHIAVVRDTNARTVDLYINGTFISTDNYVENPYNGGLTGLAIGENQGSARYDRFFEGVLDEIYIYRRALSPTEIADLYNQ